MVFLAPLIHIKSRDGVFKQLLEGRRREMGREGRKGRNKEKKRKNEKRLRGKKEGKKERERNKEGKKRKGKKGIPLVSVGQKSDVCPLPDWREIICDHFISTARCFKPLDRSPSLTNNLHPCQIQWMD